MIHAPAQQLSTSTPTGSRRVCEIRGGSVRNAERTILHRVDLVVDPTTRIAVIGDNGAGKSTLLGMIAGAVPLTAGERTVVLPGGIAAAAQRPGFADEASVEEAIDALLAEIRALEATISSVSDRLSHASDDEQPALLARLGEAVDRYEARDGYHVDQRLTIALDQLGLGGVDRAMPVASLSGGERARLALAAALSSESDLLLLDEPTNDLDDDAIAWVEARIAAHRGALVVVTHDRAFLDRFATDVVHLADGELRRYGNGYRGFLASRAAERRRLLDEHDDWQRELARNEQLVEANAFRLDEIPRKTAKSSFGHGAFRARGRDHGAVGRIRMAKERVARLRADPAPRPADPLRFTPPILTRPRAEEQDATSRGPLTERSLIAARSIRLGIRGSGPRLALDELDIGRDDHVLVTGPNGAGKTTLLRLLAGELVPEQGTVAHHEGLRIAWLRQDLRDAGECTLQHAFAAVVGEAFDDAGDRLRSFGLFQPDDLRLNLADLSIGQRRRYEIAVALASPSDVLLLDEPTNHLAPELVEQFEDALTGYFGAVVTVTHDRRWREHAVSNGSTRQLRVLPEGVCVSQQWA